MEVVFSLTEKDLVAFAQYHKTQKDDRPNWRNRLSSRSLPWLCVLALLIVWILLQRPGWHQALIPSIKSFAFGFVLGFLTLAIVYALLGKFANRSFSKLSQDERASWAFEPRRIAISPDGIKTSSDYVETVQRWPIVWKIGTTNEHVFFYFTPNEGLIVPRRAFRDQQHFQEFIALARQYQQGPYQPHPKPTGIVTGLPPESTAITRPDAP
jgi:hypothetical protein